MEGKKHVSYTGAELITGINRNTLYAMVHQRRIPHLRIGSRHVVFSVSELEAWLEKHKVEVEIAVARNRKSKLRKPRV